MLFVIASFMALIGGVIWRGENVFFAGLAFLALVWLVQIPGSLLLLLIDGHIAHRLRFILLGQALGLCLLPVIYYALFALGIWQQYGAVQSVLNVALIAALFKTKRIRLLLEFKKNIPPSKIVAFSVIILVVTLLVTAREVTQLVPRELVIRSTQEVDAGFLMGIVAGIKNYGHCVNLNESAISFKYHHLTYLLMAILSAYSRAEIVTIFNVISPLYMFLFLAVGVFYVTRAVSRNVTISVMAAILILLMDDFSILNQLIRALADAGSQTFFYATLNIAFLHTSPSWLLSFAILMVLIGELFYWQRTQQLNVRRLVVFVLIASFLAGYKVPTWMCLTGGMGAASLVLLKRRCDFFFLSTFSLLGGLSVISAFIGFSTANSFLGNVYVGYPLLRNDWVKTVFGYTDHKLSAQALTGDMIFILLILLPFWLALTYGGRLMVLAYQLKNFGELHKNNNFAELTVLFSTILGLLISLTMAPEEGSFNAYYFSLFGMLLTGPFFVVFWQDRISLRNKAWSCILVLLLVIPSLGGMVYIVKPLVFEKAIARLSQDWVDAMAFVRHNTEKHARLATNRYDLSLLPEYSSYDERFYFIPAFSERAVVVSGSTFNLVPDAEYWKRRLLVDSLLTTRSIQKAKSICEELQVNYILIDKWKGEALVCTDPRFVSLYYQNRQIEIFKVL